MGCNLRDLANAQSFDLKELAGKTIGIDAFLVAFQFITSMRNRGAEGDGGPLTNSKGQPVAHLMGFLERTTTLLELGLKPVYVFDGKHPELKADVITQRRERRAKAEKEWKEALAEGDYERAQKMGQRAANYTPEMQAQTKKLLDLLGVPWVEGEAEGEGQAAVMARRGEIDIVATQDWDALLYGSPILIRNLMSHGSRRMGRVISAERIILDDLLSEHQISREQLVDLAIMIGTDFHPGIKGIGPKTGLKLIKEHGDIETICQVKGKDVPERLAEIREIFLNHPACDVDSIQQGNVDETELRSFLIDEFEFGEKRFERNMKRLSGRIRSTGQSSLFQF
jgi:flap endonuclease-1